MSTVSMTTNCPECDAEKEVEADVEFTSQYHPYGSTTAREDLVEVEVITDDLCAECGYELTAKQMDVIRDVLVEVAQNERYQ